VFTAHNGAYLLYLCVERIMGWYSLQWSGKKCHWSQIYGQ